MMLTNKLEEIVSNNVDYSEIYLAHRVADTGLLDTVISNLKLKKGMRLLDFGCGTGNYLLALQEKGYKNLYALDKDDKMKDIATNRTSVAVKSGSHLSIPFESDFFDSIILIAMIHFIDDLNSLFKNLNRVCKNGGRVVIVTQSHKQVDARFYNKYFPSLAGIDKQRYHEPQSIISVAEETGFFDQGIQDYSNGSDLLIDDRYYNLVKDKSFYVLRLLSDDEFNDGMKLFQQELKQSAGKFITPFAGWTLITLQKGGSI